MSALQRRTQPALLSSSRRAVPFYLPAVRASNTLLAYRHISTATTYFEERPLPANTIIKFVPQQESWIVERMGKFHRILDPGLAILIPVLDSIKYVQNLRERAMEIPSQTAITADNVSLNIDGVLYVKVFDAYKASYGVEDADYAIAQLAQTTMRSEIGQLSLDHVLRERQALNANITESINEAAKDWGVKCLRYEIRDIHPPKNVLTEMHRQVAAERSKRAEILESEGAKTSAINRASGEAEAILLRAQATADALRSISQAIGESDKGMDAVGLRIAEKYVEAWKELAKEGTAVVVPGNMADMAGMVTSAMGIFKNVKEGMQKSEVKGGEGKQIEDVTKDLLGKN
ncbi:hypothetical protein G7K_3212-t1 [Saitoella complicata NRRL Y-17804]|uniref:Band 7 domain-containing protein n=2 Tax=Saitoella complicata (strain BCRC 22490 / CBS 7301 / JCM 7358 / NBRC 10748 / NRRL Y-17804) TaxID=698492 RepID=A0A0E9NH98_SAICN|nr:hypothetical protein G7K_3212-t1 [Saitoella complicata NRRL Y-17804]